MTHPSLHLVRTSVGGVHFVNPSLNFAVRSMNPRIQGIFMLDVSLVAPTTVTLYHFMGSDAREYTRFQRRGHLWSLIQKNGCTINVRQVVRCRDNGSVL